MLSDIRLLALCVLAFCCNILFLILFVKYHAGEHCYVSIDKHQEVNIILPDDFLSIGIDTSEIQENNLDFSNAKFRQLAQSLAPARLRLGGTMSERLIFSLEDVPSISCKHCHTDSSKSVCSAVRKLCKHKFLPFFIMTGRKWTEINDFSKAVNIKLLFSLNVMLRNDENKWSDQNAIELIKYSKNYGFDIDWQLGNEPNSFHHLFNVSVPPHVLAHDFKKLRKLLDHHGYKNSLLVGPDTTRPQPHRPECLQYMLEFLGNASHYINIRSWHQYYLNSQEAKLEDFWNPDTFDLLESQIKTMKNHTALYSHIPMWLSETSSAYGGGAPGLSNTYVGTPLWLDKLGLSGKYNITTVIRQSFYGGNYSLIDKHLDPLPDWWVSVLYKKLVGNKVLNIDCHCSRKQRMYAHCTNRNYTNDTTAITVYAMNLEMHKAKFLLNGTAFHGDNLSIDQFIIRAPHNKRKTKTVLLNGWPLFYDPLLSSLQPARQERGNHITMPPYSIGFWVIKNTTINICE